LPETIDRYEILQKLATGGMAELYLAKLSGMEGFEKVVVIKRILHHLASDQEFVSMFLDEARIAAKLSHPNVVQIYDLGRADDTYYIAMEYVSGRNIAHAIKKEKERGRHIPVEHAARVMSGVCEGLYYAHTRKDLDGKPLNIIHRDISPQNVLVSFAGGVKLVDFGIAKASTQLAQTRAGVLKGKYSYMSPEQVRGDRIDGRSDLFAAGIVMYEMLTAQRPFERDSSLKTLKAIVQEKPLNPRDLNPSVPAEVVKILSKALEKDSNRRYVNAQEMQLALEDWLDRSPNKSNNVRLSRYLHELFDDELNAAGGTLAVKGIGEVIIPTGASTAPQAEAAPQEGIPQGSLRAALGQPDPVQQRRPAANLPEETPVVSTPSAAPPVTSTAASALSAAPGVPLAAGAPKAAGPPHAQAAPRKGTAAPSDADPEATDDQEHLGGASDELDGATIPIYDLQAYEQERKTRHEGLPAQGAQKATENAPNRTLLQTPVRKLPGAQGGEFSNAPTVNMDAAVREAMLAQAKATWTGLPAPQGGRAQPPPPARTDALHGGPPALRNPAAQKMQEPKGPPVPSQAPAGAVSTGVPAPGPPRPPPPQVEPKRSPGADSEQDPPKASSNTKTAPLPPAGLPAEGARSDQLPPPQLGTPTQALQASMIPGLVQLPVPSDAQEVEKPWWQHRNALAAMGGAVVGLPLMVFIFFATAGPPDPGLSAADGGLLAQAPSAEMGRIYLKTSPPGCEILLSWGKDHQHVKQDVLSPAILRVPMDEQVVVHVRKDGLDARAIVVLTLAKPKADVVLSLEKPR
jgi:serine/threonine-protein kinase